MKKGTSIPTDVSSDALIDPSESASSTDTTCSDQAGVPYISKKTPRFDCGYYLYTYYGVIQNSVWRKQWDGAKGNHQFSKRKKWDSDDIKLLTDLINEVVKKGTNRGTGKMIRLKSDNVTELSKQYPAGLKDGNGKYLDTLGQYLPNRLEKTKNNFTSTDIFIYDNLIKQYGKVKFTFKAIQLYKGKDAVSNILGDTQPQYGIDVLIHVQYIP